MISISTPVFDLTGNLISNDGTAKLKKINRRARRVGVLDLEVGAVLVDGGYTPTDLTFDLSIPDTDGEYYLSLTRLLGVYSALILSCDRGCYLVLIYNIGHKKGNAICSADVLEELGL